MVLPDRVAHGAAHPVLPGQRQPLFHMVADDDAAHLRIQVEMLVRAVEIVLGEVLRHRQLADIVKERAGLRLQRIRPDRPRRVLDQRGDHEAVEEGPGSLALQPFKQRVVVIAEHHQRHVRADVEDDLECENQDQRQNRRRRRIRKCDHRRLPEQHDEIRRMVVQQVQIQHPDQREHRQQNPDEIRPVIRRRPHRQRRQRTDHHSLDREIEGTLRQQHHRRDRRDEEPRAQRDAISHGHRQQNRAERDRNRLGDQFVRQVDRLASELKKWNPTKFASIERITTSPSSMTRLFTRTTSGCR